MSKRKPTVEQTRTSEYVTHVMHLARRAGSPRVVTRYTRKVKHKRVMGDDG